MDKQSNDINMSLSYQNLACDYFPATLIILVDISSSMGRKLTSGKSRHQVALDELTSLFIALTRRSTRQGVIHTRYRFAMIAYADQIYEIYRDYDFDNNFVPIDEIIKKGLPSFELRKGTNMAQAIEYATKILRKDVDGWTVKWLENCPAPLVINITDGEYGFERLEILRAARKLKEIAVQDGNVLFENIIINDMVNLVNGDPQNINRYFQLDEVSLENVNVFMQASSTIPDSYVQLINEQAGLKIMPGISMMFPGSLGVFIISALPMVRVT